MNENEKMSRTVSVFESYFFRLLCWGSCLSDQVAGIPPFIDMFYFETEFVVWEGCIIIFNRRLFRVLSIKSGPENTKKYSYSLCF